MSSLIEYVKSSVRRKLGPFGDEHNIAKGEM